MKTSYPIYHEELQRLSRQLRLQAPSAFAAAEQFGEAALADGRLSARHKHLIALGIAIASGCEGAITTHTEAALQAGAEPEEVVECIAVAAYMGGEPAVIYGAEALAALKGFSPIEQCLLARLEHRAGGTREEPAESVRPAAPAVAPGA